jgi:hypothetical protein
MTGQGSDLVGDIHGHADALHRLLRELDYAEVEGVFRRPVGQMIFVGDFIDRGPQQWEVLSNFPLYVQSRRSNGRDGKSRI